MMYVANSVLALRSPGFSLTKISKSFSSVCVKAALAEKGRICRPDIVIQRILQAIMQKIAA